jgi:hypothetical protein
MFLLYDDFNCRIFGVFSTADAAKAFVNDTLGVTVDWSDPKQTVTGSMRSQPRARNNYHIQPVPVDPTIFDNAPRGLAVKAPY